MTIIQGLIASGGKGRPPTIDAMMGNGSQYMAEGQNNALYINVANNYPNTVLYWKIINITTNNTDWANNDTPFGTVTVYGDGQFPVYWYTSMDLTTDGTTQYGVILASDPNFVNVLYSNTGLYITDASQWTYNEPATWVWNDTYGTSSTHWDNFAYSSKFIGRDVATTSNTYQMTMTGTVTQESVTYADSSIGMVYDITPGNYLTTPNMNSGAVGNRWVGSVQGLTIELWFYPTTSGANSGSCLVSEIGDSGFYANVLEIDDSGTVGFRLWDYQGNTRITTPNAVNQYAWNHVWAQYDAVTGTAYLVLNGWNSVSSSYGWNWYKAGDTGNNAFNWNIGHTTPTVHSTGSNQRDFSGKISLVRISNYTMLSSYDQDKIKYTNYPAPVVYLDATDEASVYNGVWHDKSGHTKHAALINSPTYETRKGFSFVPNSYQYAEIANLGDLTYWSFDVWVRLTAAPSYAGLCSVITTVYESAPGQPNTGQVNFNLSNYGTMNGFSGNLGQYFAVSFFNGSWHFGGPQYLNVGEWYNIVGTWDGTYLKTYVNSAYMDNRLYSGQTSSANGGNVRIARRWDGDPAANSENFAPVEVAVARVYNTVLFQEQITANFNEHRVKFGK